MASIADNLKRLRKARKLTQEQLAAAAKLKQTAISKYENGTTPDVNSLLRLAVGLGKPIDEIVAGVSPEYDKVAAPAVAPTAPPEATVDQERRERMVAITSQLAALAIGDDGADGFVVLAGLDDSDRAAAISMMRAWRETEPAAPGGAPAPAQASPRAGARAAQSRRAAARAKTGP